MSLQLGDTAPDFTALTTEGPISFHEWVGNGWAILFSHPRDFTPVCTTELGYVARLKPEFDRRDVKAIGLSIDPVGSHQSWAADIRETQGHAPNFPIIADPDRKVGALRDDPAHDEVYTVRTVFVIDPKKKVRLMITYLQTTGRNFDEILHVIDSLQLTDAHRVATPVNWKRRGCHHRPGRQRRGGARQVPEGLARAQALLAPDLAAEIATQGASAIARSGEPVAPWILNGVRISSATYAFASASASRLQFSTM
jgi:alkyl hydroperoxide reductase subunit AhpC